MDASQQHVRETSSGGWCEFTGINARTFAVFNELLYFGDSSGRVFLADFEDSDNGANILSLCIPAFNPLGSRAQRKQMTATSVVSDYAFQAGYTIEGLADFNTSLRSGLVEGAAFGAGSWDFTDWGTTDWVLDGSGLPTTQGWRNTSAIGYALSYSLRVSQRAQNIRWYSTNIQFRQAGTI